LMALLCLTLPVQSFLTPGSRPQIAPSQLRKALGAGGHGSSTSLGSDVPFGLTGGVAMATAVLAFRALQCKGTQRARGRHCAVTLAAVRPAAKEAAPQQATQVVTGETLEAVMKMACDWSGACYAIYWTRALDDMVVSADYVTVARRVELLTQGKTSSFAEASESFRLPVSGTGPVSSVYKTGEAAFIAEAATRSDLERKDIAKEYGIISMGFIPCGGGVLEIGTSQGSETASWTSLPIRSMPVQALQTAFASLGAKYVMLWEAQDGYFSVAADFVAASEVKTRRTLRGDDKTFCSESRQFKLPAEGHGPVASASSTGKEVITPNPGQDHKLVRRSLAQEFNIKDMHCFPVTEGLVLECGVPTNPILTGNALAAALQMQCDISGAGYAIYWTEAGDELVVGGSYITPARKAALEAQGKEGSFAEAGKAFRLPKAGSGPVATVLATLDPIFIADAGACDQLKRKEIASQYGIASINLIPFAGGVLELGTSSGPETANWSEAPDLPNIPASALQQAFDKEGAAYALLWRQDRPDGDHFTAAADYVLPERRRALRNKRGDDQTFASQSKGYKLSVDPLRRKWGRAFAITDAKSNAGLNRQVLAKEFDIGRVIFAPFPGGYLECGIASM